MVMQNCVGKLTPEILRVFNKRIKIEERAGKYARNALQEVRIICRDIKFVDTDLMTKKKTV